MFSQLFRLRVHGSHVCFVRKLARVEEKTSFLRGCSVCQFELLLGVGGYLDQGLHLKDISPGVAQVLSEVLGCFRRVDVVVGPLHLKLKFPRL